MTSKNNNDIIDIILENHKPPVNNINNGDYSKKKIIIEETEEKEIDYIDDDIVFLEDNEEILFINNNNDNDNDNDIDIKKEIIDGTTFINFENLELIDNPKNNLNINLEISHKEDDLKHLIDCLKQDIKEYKEEYKEVRFRPRTFSSSSSSSSSSNANSNNYSSCEEQYLEQEIQKEIEMEIEDEIDNLSLEPEKDIEMFEDLVREQNNIRILLFKRHLEKTIRMYNYKLDENIIENIKSISSILNLEEYTSSIIFNILINDKILENNQIQKYRHLILAFYPIQKSKNNDCQENILDNVLILLNKHKDLIDPDSINLIFKELISNELVSINTFHLWRHELDSSSSNNLDIDSNIRLSVCYFTEGIL